MDKWIVDIAKQFKARDNTDYIGAIIGTVLSIEPLKIGILDNKVILDTTHIYLCSRLVENYSRTATLGINSYTANVSATDSHGDVISSINVSEKSDYDATITDTNILNINDKVLVISSEDCQNFFIVDKLI